MIAAIVANAAKSGWTADQWLQAGPDLRNSPGREAVRRGFRQFTEMPEIATSADERRPIKNKKSGALPSLHVFFDATPSVQSLPRSYGERFGNTSLSHKCAGSRTEPAINATRCGFSARQHPNYQGYV